MKKRLLCINNNMNMGGAETFLMKVFRQLDKEKYALDFCVNDFNENYYESEIKALGGVVFKIPPKTHGIFSFRKRIKAIIADGHYDYVLRITSNCFGLYDLKIAKKAGAKVTIARSSNASDGSFILSILNAVSRKMFLKYVDVKVAPSDLAARYTFGTKLYNSGNIILLKNGLNLNDYRFDKHKRETIRNEFGFGDDTFVIGHIGRFQKQKNHMKLIEIFYEFQKLNDNSRLMMIGSGELKTKIEAKVKALRIDHKVFFCGLKDNIPYFLSAFDTFVFPSLFEGMPNTVVEAQASGLPCVVSDSITKEVDITKTVTFVSNRAPVTEWIKSIKKRTDENRTLEYTKLYKSGYDIASVTSCFVKAIFNE